MIYCAALQYIPQQKKPSIESIYLSIYPSVFYITHIHNSSKVRLISHLNTRVNQENLNTHGYKLWLCGKTSHIPKLWATLDLHVWTGNTFNHTQYFRASLVNYLVYWMLANLKVLNIVNGKEKIRCNNSKIWLIGSALSKCTFKNMSISYLILK